MSLNGLDASEVNEAYQSALGEGGGWFLLKYTARDEVKLLKRGSGGVIDIRDSITNHDEQSPLYGFVHYRRRKVILKYVPEGTSRLLQARVTVHFQSITEKFTPYDTVFSFATAKGLNDVALSSACSLHTAAASIKSSSDSLRQRGLSEIAEDVSEHQPPELELPSEKQTEDPPSGVPTLQTRPERSDSLLTTTAATPLPSDERTKSNSPSRRRRNTDKALPPTPRETKETKATTRNALEDTFLDSRPSIEGRPSIQSLRPSIRSMRTSYEYRPKIKLGPRPSIESSKYMHSPDREIDVRPISTLPSGVRLPARNQAPGRPKSANGPTPIAETSEVPVPSPKPTIQSTIPAKTPSPPSNAVPKQLQHVETKTSAMTPEKRRLKKALELRQRQLAARKAHNASDKIEISQRYLAQPSTDHTKRESLTATLPDISPADDGTTDALQERIDALNQDPDIVHVGPQTLGKGEQENFEVSPISIPEVSDGPSTQASSISDEDETPTKLEPATEDKHIKDDLATALAVEPRSKNNGAVREPHSPQVEGQAPIPEPPLSNEPNTNPSMTDIAPHEKQEDASSGTLQLDPTYSQSSLGSIDVCIGESFTRVSSSSDPPSPLFVRRSSSLRSVNTGVDGVKPHEIPLPPIDEDEEISLSPHRKAFDEHSPSRSHAYGEERQLNAPLQAQKEEGLRESRSSMAESFIEQRERRTRRHGLISPMKRVSSPDYSDEQFLSDDSFMEELQCATVQEAKPISVSKSPIMPVFPRSVSESKSTDELRPASAGNRLNRPKRQDDHQPMMPKLPDLYSARSASASHAPLLETQVSPTTFKKGGVSSGISQRIKALEQLSSRPASPASQLSSPPSAPPPSNFRRKPSFPASQAAVEIAKPGSQQSNTSSLMPFPLKSHSSDRNPQNISDNVVRIDVATKSGKARPESISVTARIIRGAKNKILDAPEDPSKPGSIDLYPSPLIVEHQSMRPTTPLSPLMPPKPSYARSISSTSTTQKSDPLIRPRRDSISSRLSSTPSRRGSEPELPRTMSDTSIHSIVNIDGSKEEKKESRKSRLFKRMSNISAASRRSIASALSPVRKDIKEEPIVEHHEPSRETIQALSVDIGDVNIQFPDTLLWKRRHMKVDEQGLLVLSASKADNNSKVIPKRYPFTEFNPPYLPDQDQQELPNSVILDFRDGSSLQCACENPYMQTEVFRALKQAHYKSNTPPS